MRVRLSRPGWVTPATTSASRSWQNPCRSVRAASRARPADAEALAESIRSDPDLEATAPVAVIVGEINALQIDVVAAPGATACFSGEPHVMTTADPDWQSVTGSLGQGTRMRLYLLDLPAAGSAQVLAVAIAAPETEFERAVDAATPIVESIEFHAP